MEAQQVKISDIIDDLKKTEEPPKVKLQVFQQAVQFQFVAEATKEIVEAKMDAVWAEREPHIPIHIINKAKKGFRPQTPVSEVRRRVVNLMGGHDQFYESAYLKIISDAFYNHDPKPNVELFSWSSVDCVEKSDGSFRIVALGYFEPEVVWNEPKPANFKVSMAPVTDTAIDVAVKSYLETMMKKHNMTEVNNDLAITMGFESLAQVEGTLRKQFEDKFTRDREEKVTNTVRDFLFSKTKISPLPESWRQFKAQEAYANALSRFKNEDAFLKAIGGRSKHDVLAYYAQQIGAAIAEELVLKSWAKGVVEGDSSVENLHAYAETVRKHILKNVVIDEQEGLGDDIRIEAIDASQS